MNSVSYINDDTMYFAGNYSRIIKRIESSQCWDVENTGEFRLTSITFPSPDIGYAVGEHGTILKSGLFTSADSLNGSTTACKIFPNPCTSHLFIQNDDNEPLKIKIFDPDGHLITEKMILNELLDLQTLSPGMYLLQVNENFYKIIRR